MIPDFLVIYIFFSLTNRYSPFLFVAANATLVTESPRGKGSYFVATTAFHVLKERFQTRRVRETLTPGDHSTLRVENPIGEALGRLPKAGKWL